MRISRVPLVLLAALFLVSCGDDDDRDPTAPVGGESVTVVVGQVLQFVDATPVDGGVTVDIVLDDDRGERLLFPSMFTSPPPSNAMLRLYDVVRRVEVGDTVRAEGTRTGDSILLEKLWILDGSF